MIIFNKVKVTCTTIANLFVIAILCVVSLNLPAVEALGGDWVLDEELSDEFNAVSKELNKVIKTSDFSLMQDLEKKEDFKEAVLDPKTKKRKTFFNLGPKNNWKNLLDKKNIDIIEQTFKKEMLELGYI